MQTKESTELSSLSLAVWDLMRRKAILDCSYEQAHEPRMFSMLDSR